jgi:hypothetical protein
VGDTDLEVDARALGRGRSGHGNKFELDPAVLATHQGDGGRHDLGHEGLRCRDPDNGHDTADVTFTPDNASQPSYHGHETYAFHETGSGDTSTTTTTFHVRMNATDRAWLDVRETAHLTLGPNGPTVSFDSPRLSCS